MQLSLLDLQPSRADAGFAHARRMELGDGAWLELVPGWLSGPTALFDRLYGSARWERRRRSMYERTVEVPRLVAPCPGGDWEQGFEGDEVVQRFEPLDGDAAERCVSRELRGLAAVLGRRYGRLLERITLAHYRDGRDSVAFHGDKLGDLRADTVVAILSLGARRRFALRPVQASAHARPITLTVGEGDLLVMGGSCQLTWQHAVPKVRQAGPRIAVMFRERLPEGR